MAIKYKHLDVLRRGRSEHENHLIDGLVAGRVSRREFMRYGSVAGLSACRSSAASRQRSAFRSTPRPARAAAPGGTIRVAQIVPAAAIDPGQDRRRRRHHRPIAGRRDPGPVGQGPDRAAGAGRELVAQQGRHGVDLQAAPGRQVPQRQGDDGRRRGRDLRPPGRSRQSARTRCRCSRGMLSKGGTRKVDDYTVEFHLDAANGNFPYAVSTDNYNAVILPADYTGDFEKNMIGTGPFKLEKYTPKVGASFVRNDDYWGGQALPDRIELELLRRLPAADPGAAGRPGRHHPADPGAAGRRPAQRSRISTSSARRRPRISRCTCAPTSIRSRTSGCAARSRSASTGRRSCRA